MQTKDPSSKDKVEDLNIFRKSPLKKLSSPEQLNDLVEIIDIRLWIAIAAIGCITITALLWSIFGSVEIKVSGIGMLMREGSIFTIHAMGEGIVEDFTVKVGDPVKKGQKIGHISQKAIENQIKNNEKIVETLRNQYNEVKIIYDKQQSLLGHGIVSALEFAETKQRLLSQQVEMTTAKEKLDVLRDQLERNSDIVSHHNGVVIEIATDKGSFVENGAQVAVVEEEDVELNAMLYFSLSEGKKILDNMQARVVPSVIKKEEFGFIYGKVKTVSKFPMTPIGLSKRVHNEVLVKRLMESNALYEVCVDLIEDAKTPSGYKWSSRIGPKVKIQTGTTCRGEIVIRKERPISLVVPLLKKHLLGIGQENIVKNGNE